MKTIIVLIIFLISFTVFSDLQVFGNDETRIIISEIDDTIFKAALNSTIISTDGKIIGKLEIANPEEIGQVFVLELKNKEKDEWGNLKINESVIVGGTALLAAIIGLFKFSMQQKTRNNLEFSKLLNEFEDKWTYARSDWKCSNKDESSCYAMIAKRLSILDSIAFLTKSEKISPKMLEYFQVHFSEGRLYLKWIEGVEKVEKNAWPFFASYVMEMKPIPKIASVKFLPLEFHMIYKIKSTNEFKDIM